MTKDELNDIKRRHNDAFQYLKIARQSILPGFESLLDALECALLDCKELFEHINELENDKKNDF